MIVPTHIHTQAHTTPQLKFIKCSKRNILRWPSEYPTSGHHWWAQWCTKKL